MATHKFIIRKNRINKNGRTTIYLQYVHGSVPKLISTELKIDPKFWNESKGKVRSSHPDFNGVSGILSKIEMKVNRIIHEALMKEIEPTTDYVKNKMSEKEPTIERASEKAIRKPATSKINFFKAFDEFISINKSTKAKGTIAKYGVLKKHVLNFEKKRKFKISFERITYDFFELFQDYFITDLDNTNNTFHKNIKVLKTFMNWGLKKDYHSNRAFNDFKLSVDETDFIYLTEKELMQFYNHDFSNHQTLAEVRDLFCFCCFTSLRLSDVSNLKQEDIKGDKIFQQRQIKTRKVIAQIPLNNFALEILERNINRYSFSKLFFKKRSSQIINRALKEAAKAAGIDDEITMVQYKGARRIETTVKKYEAIKSHTARRTFITLSLEKGMRPETLMKITGHTSLKTLMRYVKIADNIIEDEMLKAWDK